MVLLFFDATALTTSVLIPSVHVSAILNVYGCMCDGSDSNKRRGARHAFSVKTIAAGPSLRAYSKSEREREKEREGKR